MGTINSKRRVKCAVKYYLGTPGSNYNMYEMTKHFTEH
jgi:hypothetical protein